MCYSLTAKYNNVLFCVYLVDKLLRFLTVGRKDYRNLGSTELKREKYTVFVLIVMCVSVMLIRWISDYCHNNTIVNTPQHKFKRLNGDLIILIFANALVCKRVSLANKNNIKNQPPAIHLYH